MFSVVTSSAKAKQSELDMECMGEDIIFIVTYVSIYFVRNKIMYAISYWTVDALTHVILVDFPHFFIIGEN